MTDEEMAEEYTDRTRIVDENTRVGTDCISLVQDYEGNYIDIHERIKQAFLTGLKAGRPQWHKVADGDLPKGFCLVLYKDTSGVNSYSVVHPSWYIAGTKAFFENNPRIIAWCEIPTFDKE